MAGTLFCFGDSNTYGYNPSSCPGGRYPPEVRWTGRPELAGWQVVNLGLSGRGIPWRKWELTRAADQLSRSGPGDVIVILLGTNDLLHGCTAEEAERRMASFLEVLAPLAGTPLLTAPPPMAAGPWSTPASVAQSQRLADRYADLARRLGVPFADSGGWGVELSRDGVHFTPEGHRSFARGLAAVLAQNLSLWGLSSR